MNIARTRRGLAAAIAGSALALAPAAAFAHQSEAATAAPGVSFVTPKTGATTPSTVTAKVKLVHFRLSAKDVGKKPKAGEGHLHFAMDNGKFDHPKYSGANGKLAVMLGIAGKYSPAVTPSITYANLPKGKHTLVVMLANNDHSPQGAKASISFRVK
jgi:hypothetical protein